jgi:hypothetical protein
MTKRTEGDQLSFVRLDRLLKLVGLRFIGLVYMDS